MQSTGNSDTPSEPQTIHFVGIGGIGMSAIARLLLEDGAQVTGSDLHDSAMLRDLERRGARVFTGHHAAHLGTPDLVVITAAVRPDNPEVAEARARGIPVLKRAEMLGRMMEGRRGIAVAGTHGKTTTSSLIAVALVRAGLDPTVLVGGEVPELGGNARRGSGPFLVAEADEFDGSFLALRPEIAVVTNVEAEHLDYYGSFEKVAEAFGRFLANVPESGAVVYCADDPLLARLQAPRSRPGSPSPDPEDPSQDALLRGGVRARRLVGYGLRPGARWQAQDLRPNVLGGTDFTAVLDGSPFGGFSLRIPGRHNVSNALAVLAASHLLCVEAAVLRDVLGSFGGVKRRFELLGEAGGLTVIDDYAHHPTEVRATLAAARQRYPARPIHCVFQPHTYSRTKLLMPLFATAFAGADSVCITEIYAAREDNVWGVSGAELAKSIQHPSVRFVPSLEEAAALQARERQAGDVLLVMGAGDVYRAGALVLQQRSDRGA